MKHRAIWIAALVFQLLCSPLARAEGIDLDLTSSTADQSADGLLSSHGASSAVIDVGGAARTVSPGTMLTPAELLAVHQVLSSGQQSILLGAGGNAVGGTFAMGALFTDRVSSLVIPASVTAVRDFGVSPALNLAGNLVNAGTLYAVSSSPQVTTAAISAANISNQQGALLSTVLPASGLPGLANLVGSLNLSLSAVHDIINAGNISSSGSLTATAGGSIVNALPAGVSGPAPVMQALNDLTMQAASIVNQGLLASQLANVNALTAALTNSGVIQAAAGSVVVANMVDNTLLVENALGTIQARDSIALRTLETVLGDNGEVLSKASLALNGGTLAAERLEFASPGGVVAVHAGLLDGDVAATAGEAAIGSATGDLRIVHMELSGDPIYYAQGGSLDISGLFVGGTLSTSGGDFVALASGNITAATAPTNALVNAHTTATQGGVGGKITIAAGVEFTVSGTSPISCTSCDSLFSIDGVSSTGGNVDMPNVSLRTNAKAISIEAHAGSTAAGTISMKNLETSGRAHASNQGGGVTCQGCSGQSAGQIAVLAPGNIEVGYVRAFGAGGGGIGSGYQSPGPGGNGADVTIASTLGSVTINGDINTSGGGGGGANLPCCGNGSGSGIGAVGGNAGNITVSAQGALTINGPVLAAGGGRGANNSGNNGGGGGGSFGGGGGGGASGGGSGNKGGSGGGGFYGGGGGGSNSSTQPGVGAGGGGNQAGGGLGWGGVANGVAGGLGFGGRGGGQSTNTGFGLAGAGGSGATAVGGSGNGGVVDLSGQTVAITKTINTAFGFTGTYAGLTIAALGSGGSITVASAGGSTTPVVYSTNGNFLSTVSSFQAEIGTASSPFVVGSVPNSNGSAGNIQAGTITLNGVNLSGTISSGSYGTSGPNGQVTLTMGGSPVAINNGDFVTPAQWIAIIQASSGSQTLTLDAQGRAVGGSFSISDANVPWEGFTSLLIPEGVTANASASSILVGGAATVSGTLNYTGNGSISADSVTVDGTLQSSGGSLTVNTSNLENNGNLSASGDLTINSFNAPLTMTGTPASSIAATAPNSVIHLIASNNQAMNINSSFSFDAGATGAVSFTAGTFNLAAGKSVSTQGGSKVALEAHTVNLGAGSSVSSSRTTGSAVELFRYYEGMTINVPAEASATISSAGGTIDVFADSLSFVPGGANSQLNLNGPTLLKSQNGNLTVGANLALVSNNNLSLQVHGGNQLINNGSITSSAEGGSIAITGSNLTLSGTGGPVAVTGGGAASISVIGFDGGLTVGSSYELNAGASGIVTVGASSNTLTIAENKTLSVTGGSELVILAKELHLANNSTISSSKATGDAIRIISPYTTLTVAADDAGAGTISSNGGAITISPLGGGNSLVLGQEGATAQLNFDGGPVTATVVVGSVTIRNGTTVSSDSSLAFNLNGYNSVLTNDGSVSSAGNLQIASPYDLTVTGSGNIATINGNVTVIAGVNALNITHNLQANEGNLTIRNTDIGSGTIFIGPGSFLKAFTGDKQTGLGQTTLIIGTGVAVQLNTANPDAVNISVTTSGGGQVFFGAGGITATGSNNSIQGIAADVTFDSGGRPASAITLGGNVTIIADPPAPDGSPAPLPITAPLLVSGAAAEPAGANNMGASPAGSGLQSTGGADLSAWQPSRDLTVSMEALYLDFRSLISFDGITGGDASSSGAPSRYASRSHQNHWPREGSAGDGKGSISDADLMPISYGAALPAAPASASAGGGTTGVPAQAACSRVSPAIMAQSADTVARDSDGIVQIDQGAALVSSDSRILIAAGERTVECPPRALVLVSLADGVLTVRTLHNGAGNVRLLIAGRQVTVAPGQQVITARSEAAVKAALDADRAGRRRLNMAQVPGGHHLAQCDVSLVSLLRDHPLLHEVMSRRDAKTREAAGKIMKTAACLMVVTQRHGAYQNR